MRASGSNGRASVDYDPARNTFVAFFVDPFDGSVVSSHTSVDAPVWKPPTVALDASGTGPGTRVVCGAAFDGSGRGLFAGTVSQLGSSPVYCTTTTALQPCASGAACIGGVCGGSPAALALDRIRTYEVVFDADTDAYLLGNVGGLGPAVAGEDVTASSCGIAYDPQRDRVIAAWTDPYQGELRVADRIGLTSDFPDMWSPPYQLLGGVHGSVDIAFLSGIDRWMVTFSASP